MEIRSITLFADATVNPADFQPFLTAVRTAFAYPVQTTRLATPPFPDWWDGVVGSMVQFAQQWQEVGIDYASLGPVQLGHDDAGLDALPALLSATDMLFASVEVADWQIADRHGRLSLSRCRQTARLIRQVSTILENGFGNLYLTAVANCPPGSPFFPVAYHQGGPAHFAIAVQSADLARQAIQSATSLDEARHNLVTAIETAATSLTETAEKLSAQFPIPFSGIDFSLAPFPTDTQSLGGAMEALGLPYVGAAGSLFAAGFITEAIERAQFRRCGFSGLMLPVLEDEVLARRAAEGVLSLQDLLSYCAVCGVGLDTIPLPGEVSEEQLTAVLLDIAMLATRLNKPLTARLMPLPGLQAGDPVSFDFPYFAPSRVMAVAGAGTSGLLQPATQLSVNPVAIHGPDC
ncbi:MAG: DUF711 family protein [Anaerolineae bacterium]|nr:DUF711 family protein [Anaerolineae bacterium]